MIRLVHGEHRSVHVNLRVQRALRKRIVRLMRAASLCGKYPRRTGWPSNSNRRHPSARLLYHHNRGVQHACGGFSAALAEVRLVASTNCKANRYDNAASLDCIEVFHNRVRLCAPSAINSLWNLKPN